MVRSSSHRIRHLHSVAVSVVASTIMLNAIEAFGRSDQPDISMLGDGGAHAMAATAAGPACGLHSTASGPTSCMCNAGYDWVSPTSNDCVLAKKVNLTGTVAGMVAIVYVGTAVVGAAVGAGVAAAMAKPGQKPAYLKGAVIGAGSLFGAGLLYGAVKKK
jgi:hypothetical protein